MKIEFASQFDITLPRDWIQLSLEENFPKPTVFGPPGATDWSVVIGLHVTPTDPELLSQVLEKPQLLAGSRRSKQWREIGNLYNLRDESTSRLLSKPSTELISGKQVLVLKLGLEAEPDAGLQKSDLHLVVALCGSEKVQMFLLTEVSQYERYLPVFLECLQSITWLN